MVKSFQSLMLIMVSLLPLLITLGLIIYLRFLILHLISFVHKLCLQNNAFCYFDAHKFLIQDLPLGKILYKGLSKDGVYHKLYRLLLTVQLPMWRRPFRPTSTCSNQRFACIVNQTLHPWGWNQRLGLLGSCDNERKFSTFFIIIFYWLTLKMNVNSKTKKWQTET